MVSCFRCKLAMLVSLLLLSKQLPILYLSQFGRQALNVKKNTYSCYYFCRGLFLFVIIIFKLRQIAISKDIYGKCLTHIMADVLLGVDVFLYEISR